MRTTIVASFILASSLLVLGCVDDSTFDAEPDGSVSLEGLESIRIEPADVVLTITSNKRATQLYRAMGTYRDGVVREVTEMTTFSLASARVGVFSNNLFTSASDWGGTTTVEARTESGITAQTGVKVVFSRRYFAQGIDPETEQAFEEAHADPTASVELVSPPNGVLLPPNLSDLEVQWIPGEGQVLFEVAFYNDASDIRIYAPCNKIEDKGCGYTPVKGQWGQIAKTFGGDEPLAVRVRGLIASKERVGSSGTRGISIAEQPAQGGLYYWSATSGDIIRYDFGQPGSKAETFLSKKDHGCIGCHALSFNGSRIAVVGSSTVQVFDVASKQALASGSADFMAFSPDAQRLVTASPPEPATPSSKTRLVLAEAATLEPLVDPLEATGTMPDWSPDGDRLVYVEPGGATQEPQGPYSVGNGSIMIKQLDQATGSWSEPTTLVKAADGHQNNYYPTFSPSGELVIYNRVPSGSSYDNQEASLWAVRADGKSEPIELKAANGASGVCNSWPKFSPFVHTYKGRTLFWLTFSSRRDHGLRTKKDTGLLPGPGSGSRNVAQIWMAAVELGNGELGEELRSYPAFRLPFQSPDTGNHIAQWTAKVVGKQCGPDNGCPEGEECKNGHCEPAE